MPNPRTPKQPPHKRGQCIGPCKPHAVARPARKPPTTTTLRRGRGSVPAKSTAVEAVFIKLVRRYVAELVARLSRVARAVGRGDALPGKEERRDAPAAHIRRRMAQERTRFERQRGTRLRAAISDISHAVNNLSAQEQQRAFATLGGRLGGNTPEMQRQMDEFVRTSANLIRSIPGQLSTQMEQQIRESIARNETADQLAARLVARGEVAVSRAELIARDQTQRLYGRLNGMRQQAAGIFRYIWGPTDSEDPRDLHTFYRGKPFDWDDPPDGGHPGELINCKCVAVPFTG